MDSIILKLKEIGFLKDLTEEEFEELYIGFMSDKMIPKRWLEDMKAFASVEYFESYEKYNAIVESDNEIDDYQFNDLEKILGKSETRSIKEVVANQQARAKELAKEERKEIKRSLVKQLEEEKSKKEEENSGFFKRVFSNRKKEKLKDLL